MTTRSILWRRLDQPGHDAALLTERATGATLEGMAVFKESGRPCRLHYVVECDAGWRTVSARVTGSLDTTLVDLAIGADGTRAWRFNGQSCPAVHGSADVDLSFTPATNLLPIRRVKLATGQRAEVSAAWLRFPELTLEPLDQVYERVSEFTYRYSSRQGSFVALLETNATGFVTHYPNLWQLETC